MAADKIRYVSITRLVLGCVFIFALHIYTGWKWWQLLTTGSVTFRQGPERWPEDAVTIVFVMTILSLQFGLFPLLWWQIRRGLTVIRG